MASPIAGPFGNRPVLRRVVRPIGAFLAVVLAAVVGFVLLAGVSVVEAG